MATAVQCSPHVALLVDTVTIRHCILAISVVLGHYKERPLVLDGASCRVKVESVNGLLRAVSKIHGIIVFVPGGAVRNLNIAHWSIKTAIGVQTEYSTLVAPVRYEWVEHEASPESTLRIDGSIIATELLMLVRGYLLG